MIDIIFCFFFCAKVIVHQPAYVPKPEQTQEVQDEEPLSRSPERGKEIQRISQQRLEQRARNDQGTATDSKQSEVETQICQVFKDNCQEAIKVAVCESGLRPTAVSNTQDYGIFQIHLPAHASKIPVVGKVAYLFDPIANINLAYTIWSKQGFLPWRSSFKCHGII